MYNIIIRSKKDNIIIYKKENLTMIQADDFCNKFIENGYNQFYDFKIIKK